LERIEKNEEDLEFLTKPSKEGWNFLAGRFQILATAARNSMNRVDALRQNKQKDELQPICSAREVVILRYILNEQKCLARLAEIAVSRRDNNPEDLEPGGLELELQSAEVGVGTDVPEKGGKGDDGVVTVKAEIEVLELQLMTCSLDPLIDPSDRLAQICSPVP
jgi:hypothetical protein